MYYKVQLGLNRFQTHKNKVQRKTIYYHRNEKRVCGGGREDPYILKIQCSKKYLTLQGHTK